MNKIFTLLAGALLLSATAVAQSNTMVLIEEGTQASCPPCAAQNPGFDALLDANEDKVVVLKYQTSWPGFDQMNLDNPTEVAARVSYYGFNGVPTAFMNGSTWPNDCGAWAGAPACLNQSEIDDAHAVISPLTMEVAGQLQNSTLVVTGTITADQALSGNLKLRLALAERVINYEDVPGGTNGETSYYHVLKKFIGGTSGISLPDMEAGDTYTINQTLGLLHCSSMYDFDMMEIIAFVQDDLNKQVHQAAKDETVEIILDATNNAAACQVLETPSSLCVGTESVSPVIKLINAGSAVMTSAEITYTASGGATETYNWTGSLNPLASEAVTLDPIDVLSNAWNDATIEIVAGNPNAQIDEVELDNYLWATIPSAPEAGTSIEIVLTTDGYGDEVYWEIRNGANDIIASGGNPNVGIDNIGTGMFPPAPSDDSYGNNQTYNIDVTLDNSDCYTFHITDYYGDGLLAAGGFSILDGNGEEIHYDSEDYNIESLKSFSSGAVVSIQENILNDAFTIYPNPSSEELNVSYNIESSGLVTFDIVNMLGAKVATQIAGSNAAGLIQFDIKNLDAGVYQLNVITGESFGSKSVTIVR